MRASGKSGYRQGGQTAHIRTLSGIDHVLAQAVASHAGNEHQRAIGDAGQLRAAWYGFLAQRYAPNQDVNLITPALLPSVEQQAVRDSIPNVFVTFWSFRVMMVLGFYFVAIFAFAARAPR